MSANQKFPGQSPKFQKFACCWLPDWDWGKKNLHRLHFTAKHPGILRRIGNALSRNRLTYEMPVIGSIYAKNTDAVCSQPTPEGTHAT